jgi:hypothetical protein
MRTLALVLIGALCCAPALAATTIDMVPGPGTPAPANQLTDTPCTGDQGAVEMSGAVGLRLTTPGDPVHVGSSCDDPSAPDPNATLQGLGFPVASCQDGFVIATSITLVDFSGAPEETTRRLYLWREVGGLPLDTCGLECAAANGDAPIVKPPLAEPTPQVWDWTAEACPCLTFSGEILWIGSIYEYITTNGQWYAEYDDTGGASQFGFGFGNLTGVHGGWEDLANYGFGSPYHVSNTVDIECGGVPVEDSSWGAMKNLYR